MDKKYLVRDKIVGKEVIDSNGMMIGNVKDIAIDLNSKDIDLTVQMKTGTDMVLEGESIIVVGDVVLINKKIEMPISSQLEKDSKPEVPQIKTQPTIGSGLCSSCSYQNEKSAKFCIKCGQKLR